MCEWLNSLASNAALLKYRVPETRGRQRMEAPLQTAYGGRLSAPACAANDMVQHTRNASHRVPWDFSAERHRLIC